MKQTTKKLSTSVEFTVEFGREDFEAARLKALARLARNVKIPGFRNGKAPANVVEKHVDPNDLSSTTLDIMVRDAIPRLYSEAEISPLTAPQVEVKKFIPGDSAEIVVTSDIMPEVKLGDYKKLTADYEIQEITDEDVEEIVDRICENFSERKTVDRAAELGDEVLIDFVGKKDGVAFEGGSAKDYALGLGSGNFIPGFEDGVVSHKAGEEFDLPLTFPENYANEDLAGAETVFTITLKEVREMVKLEKDNELAKKTGAFPTIAELRDDIRKNLESQAEREANHAYQDELLDMIVKKSKTEAPENLVKEQAEAIKQDMLQNLKSHGFTIEQYLERNKQKTEDWEREVREAAERRVTSSIIVQKLADELEITVSDEEAEQKYNEMRMVYGKDKATAEQFDDPEVYNGIMNRMRIDRTLEKLVEINKPNAKVKKIAKEAPAKKAAAKTSKAKTSKKKAE